MTKKTRQVPSWCQKLIEGTLPRAHCDARLGLVPVFFEVGHSVWSLEVAEHHKNAHGVVGGGVIGAGLDTALASAAAATLARTHTCVTTQHSVTYLTPARTAGLRFEGRVVHEGRRLLYAEGEATDLEGRLVARAHQTLTVIERRSVGGDKQGGSSRG